MRSLINNKRFSTHTTRVLPNFINGEFVTPKANKFYDITNPSTQDVLSRVPETPNDEFNHAVDVAKETFKSWRNVPVLTRQRYMFDFLRLLRERQVSRSFDYF